MIWYCIFFTVPYHCASAWLLSFLISFGSPCIWTKNSVLIRRAASLSFSFLEPHSESTSSMKMIEGLCWRARSNKFFTNLGDTGRDGENETESDIKTATLKEAQSTWVTREVQSVPDKDWECCQSGSEMDFLGVADSLDCVWAVSKNCTLGRNTENLLKNEKSLHLITCMFLWHFTFRFFSQTVDVVYLQGWRLYSTLLYSGWNHRIRLTIKNTLSAPSL